MSEESPPRDAEVPQSEAPQAQPEAPVQIDATGVVLTCVSLLASKAWEAMGLVPSPVTKKIERHLEEAQLAIDAAAGLVDLVRGKVGEAERRELDTLLMNLRINFVEQRSKA